MSFYHPTRYSIFSIESSEVVPAPLSSPRARRVSADNDASSSSIEGIAPLFKEAEKDYIRREQLPVSTNWTVMYDLLCQYTRESDGRFPTILAMQLGGYPKGMFDVTRLAESYIYIGEWVDAQQRRGKRSFDKEQADLLEAVQGWRWEPLSSEWSRLYDHLRRTIEINRFLPRKHEVSQYYEDDAIIAEIAPSLRWAKHEGLGQWIACLRRSYRFGLHGDAYNKVNAERIKLLEALPNWNWDVCDDRWNKRCEWLCEFAKEMGGLSRGSDILLPPQLKQWVEDIRRSRKGLATMTLTPTRIARLEAIPGWKW